MTWSPTTRKRAVSTFPRPTGPTTAIDYPARADLQPRASARRRPARLVPQHPGADVVHVPRHRRTTSSAATTTAPAPASCTGPTTTSRRARSSGPGATRTSAGPGTPTSPTATAPTSSSWPASYTDNQPDFSSSRPGETKTFSPVLVPDPGHRPGAPGQHRGGRPPRRSTSRRCRERGRAAARTAHLGSRRRADRPSLHADSATHGHRGVAGDGARRRRVRRSPRRVELAASGPVELVISDAGDRAAALLHRRAAPRRPRRARDRAARARGHRLGRRAVPRRRAPRPVPARDALARAVLGGGAAPRPGRLARNVALGARRYAPAGSPRPSSTCAPRSPARPAATRTPPTARRTTGSAWCCMRPRRPRRGLRRRREGLWNAAWRVPARLAMARLDAAAGRGPPPSRTPRRCCGSTPTTCRPRDRRVALRRLGRDDEAERMLAAPPRSIPSTSGPATSLGDAPSTPRRTTCSTSLGSTPSSDSRTSALRVLDLAADAALRHPVPGAGNALPLVHYHRAEALERLGRQAAADAARTAARDGRRGSRVPRRARRRPRARSAPSHATTPTRGRTRCSATGSTSTAATTTRCGTSRPRRCSIPATRPCSAAWAWPRTTSRTTAPPRPRLRARARGGARRPEAARRGRPARPPQRRRPRRPRAAPRRPAPRRSGPRRPHRRVGRAADAHRRARARRRRHRRAGGSSPWEGGEGQVLRPGRCPARLARRALDDGEADAAVARVARRARAAREPRRGPASARELLRPAARARRRARPRRAATRRRAAWAAAASSAGDFTDDALRAVLGDDVLLGARRAPARRRRDGGSDSSTGLRGLPRCQARGGAVDRLLRDVAADHADVHRRPAGGP